MPDAFRITSMVPGLPERVYSAWLDSHAHAAFTGASARIDPSIGGKFSVLDGSVSGRTVELLPGRRIVQTWRAKEFPSGSRDSRLEIQFEGTEGATRVTIMHSVLPPGQGERLKQAWIQRYFQPLRTYFARLIPGGAQPSHPSPRAAPTQAPQGTAPAPTKAAAKPKARLKVPPEKTSSKPRKTNKPRKSAAKTAARRPVARKGRR
jgi:uncharacterized protein YndB with AHSA1/START domain